MVNGKVIDIITADTSLCAIYEKSLLGMGKWSNWYLYEIILIGLFSLTTILNSLGPNIQYIVLHSSHVGYDKYQIRRTGLNDTLDIHLCNSCIEIMLFCIFLGVNPMLSEFFKYLWHKRRVILIALKAIDFVLWKVKLEMIWAWADIDHPQLALTHL